MSRLFTFRCNLPARAARKSDGKFKELGTFGPNRSVNLLLDDIARVFQQHLSGRVADALDIAAFVYAADSATARTGGWVDGAIEPWSREFRFEIGVRDHDFWCRDEVRGLLSRVISFLSDDVLTFSFEPLLSDRAVQEYLNLGPASHDDWPFYNPSRVLLFSGGLDSLAGAVEQAARGENLVLVSHRAVSTIDKRQQELYERLKATFQAVSMLRVPVWVNNVGGQNREYTQRTRSFLFWALALAVGTSVRAKGMTFFENGVVSLNLPVADQVLRARASRTTHPASLQMLEELAALVVDRPFVVDNPFVLLTKAEVVQKIEQLGAGDLIRSSCSCSRTRAQRAVGWHCGCCSQCIDRRLAMIASGHPDLDPEIDYAVAVLTGARVSETDQTLAFSYARHAMELARASPEQVAEQFNTEIARAARAFHNPTIASKELIEMHLRHGHGVQNAIVASVSAHAMELVEGEVDPTSLLGLIVDRQHLTPSWKRLAGRIGSILERGVPTACQSRKPDNETHLQEICDGLLRAADERLVREFPYLRWASRMTKPDWSIENAWLWVELKYIRTSAGVRKATEEIAADITKYRDNGRRILFVVYDPLGCVTDPASFAADISRHEGIIVKIIR
jgi:7-cyano-7-deazaguanine synthase in queuosine biosynthesis